MKRTYRYLHLDVFTNQLLSGNQLAVFTDPSGLDSEVMQAIALEMAFSETTFILPAQNPDTDFRVRIFTPRAELPMAGHPTVGTTFALAHDGRIAPGTAFVKLGLGIGPVPVGLEWSSDHLHFAWMTQPLPEFGPPLSAFPEMARALGIEERDIRTNLPIQVVSCGLPFLFVPVVSRSAVNAAQFERSLFKIFCAAAGIDELGVYIFSLEPSNDDAITFSRMFAPGLGVTEDPATGGACGPLGCYLVEHAVLREDVAAHMLNLQGVAMGRPSRIYISIGQRDGRISSVRVGGESVLVGEGTIELDRD
jgi:trans-2,3-dihydro-3-hydroxyanthranilate isomerase